MTVRRGQGVITKGDEQRLVTRGQTAVIAGGERGDIRIEAAAFPDAWESWVIQREDQVRGAQSWGQLNRNYVGAQDLDRHGDWREAPDYGRVWVPRVAGPDWAPYREGYWVWKPYWGWVWVSNEPWGWAPYHYGRWVMIDGAWAWWPGPVTVHYVPVWAPAYVAFFDFDHRHHPRPGHVAWLPLGPADWCHPWWSRHNGPRPGGPGPVRAARTVGEMVGRVPHAPAIRPLVPPGRRQFSVLAGAEQDARIRKAASDLPVGQFGQRQRSSGRAGLDDATFRKANLVVGGAPAIPLHSAPPRTLGPDNRPAGPRPATMGGARGPAIDKPMTQPPLQPSAIMPQKIPGERDHDRRPQRDITPRDESSPAIRRGPERPFPAPSASPAPPVTVVRPPVAAPAPTPQPRLREFQRDQAAPAERPPRFDRSRPAQVEPARPSPQIERPAPTARPAHIEPMRPSAPPPQVERPAPARPAHVEPMRPSAPPPQVVRPTAPVHVERPAPPPQRAAPPPAPSPAPARPAARSDPPPRSAPQKNCGPKPCG